MADVLARFRCSLGCFGDTDCYCFGVGHVQNYVCAKLVTSCHRLPWSPVVIHPHREDTNLRTLCFFFLGSFLAVSLSPDLVVLTKDPLSAHYLDLLAPTSALTRDPSSLPLEIVASAFNKGYPNLAVRWEAYSAFVQGCLDDCDLSGGCAGFVALPVFCCAGCWRGQPDELA